MFPFPDLNPLMDERRTEVTLEALPLALELPVGMTQNQGTLDMFPLDLSLNSLATESAVPTTPRSKSTKNAPVDEQPKGTKFPYITGHCANGAHEGNKTFSARGTLLQPCRGMYTWRFTAAFCTCWCHELASSVRMMEATIAEPVGLTTHPAETSVTVTPSVPSGRSMILPDIPDVVIVPPDPHWLYRQLILSPTVTVQLANMVRTQILDEPAVLTDDMATDDLERRRRGELDDNVELVCRLWLDGKLPWGLLTTDAIAAMVDIVNPPSQGAIYAVLNRWAGKGFAMIETKPMRFVGFNENVLKIGLKESIARADREAKRRAKGMF